jgi:hypothetical protein
MAAPLPLRIKELKAKKQLLYNIEYLDRGAVTVWRILDGNFSE